MEENKKTDELREVLSFLGESDNDGEDAIFALLALDDEHFEEIAGIFLLELEKSLSTPQTKIQMAQIFNATDLTFEEYSKEIKKGMDALESPQLKEELSQKKIDFLKQLISLSYNSISETVGIAKKIIKIPIEKCHPDAKIPVYAHLTDAGADLYAVEDISIAPGETKLIPTGLKVAIPRGYEIQVRPKSGRALKTKLRIANTPGTIDSGYRDEIGVIIDNIEHPIQDIKYHFENGKEIVIDSILHGKEYTISKGDKFAQLVLSEVGKMEFMEVESVSKITGNRGGGFGSTGLK